VTFNVRDSSVYSLVDVVVRRFKLYKRLKIERCEPGSVRQFGLRPKSVTNRLRSRYCADTDVKWMKENGDSCHKYSDSINTMFYEISDLDSKSECATHYTTVSLAETNGVFARDV